MFSPVNTYGAPSSTSRAPSRWTNPGGPDDRAPAGSAVSASSSPRTGPNQRNRRSGRVDGMAVSCGRTGGGDHHPQQGEQQVRRAAHGEVGVEGHEDEHGQQVGQRGGGAYRDPREGTEGDEERDAPGPQQPQVPALDVDVRAPRGVHPDV